MGLTGPEDGTFNATLDNQTSVARNATFIGETHHSVLHQNDGLSNGIHTLTLTKTGGAALRVGEAHIFAPIFIPPNSINITTSTLSHSPSSTTTTIEIKTTAPLPFPATTSGLGGGAKAGIAIGAIAIIGILSLIAFIIFRRRRAVATAFEDNKVTYGRICSKCKMDITGDYRLECVEVKLVIKNTGHDYLGRSSGAGSLSIWTHQLKGISFTDSFVADGCKKGSGVPAVTLGAAEQWRDVYKAADEHNVTVVGGAANSVGAAGGWLQGGGHSPLGVLYGMGVDNVLQFTVVKADGKIVKANACQNKDLFWALRGGGGSTYGVALDVTYKTHPPLNNVVAVAFTSNVTSPEKLTDMTEVFFRSLPKITDSGVRGYAFWPSPISFAFIAIHPNGQDVSTTNATLQPVFDWAANNTGTQALSRGAVHPTFYNFFTTWITDVAIADPVWLGGR
ncbi:hypothetical protein FRC07_001176, partial [Ceratobasidium sp. 392]